MLSLVSASLEALFFFSHPQGNTSVFQQKGKCHIQDKCPILSKFSICRIKYLLVDFAVSDFNEPNPQPESAAVGSHFPIFKQSAALCMLFVVELKMHMSFVLAAKVGPKAQ